ncbi:MAG: Ig-like domain-containing protein [Candidatus Shapirobacteria bacterium]|jgi:hypothetical protein
MKDNKTKIIIIAVALVVGVALTFYLAASVIPKALTILTKASGSAKVSIKNSFIIGEKILAKADGKDKCEVNVFVLDASGKGILGKQVQLTGLTNLTAKTNEQGKANFEMVSSVAGSYELRASVNGVALTKSLKVVFK